MRGRSNTKLRKTSNDSGGKKIDVGIIYMFQGYEREFHETNAYRGTESLTFECLPLFLVTCTNGD